MNLLLRPIFEPAAEQPFIRYHQKRRRPAFDLYTDDEEIVLMIVAIDDRKGHR